jgi:STE24 endopeptidase
VTAALFTAIFIAALGASLAAKYWLAYRQTRFVAAHRAEVPPAFADRVALAAHQKAADYTIARTRFGVVENGWRPCSCWHSPWAAGLAVLVGWTGSLGLGGSARISRSS